LVLVNDIYKLIKVEMVLTMKNLFYIKSSVPGLANETAIFERYHNKMKKFVDNFNDFRNYHQSYPLNLFTPDDISGTVYFTVSQSFISFNYYEKIDKVIRLFDDFEHEIGKILRYLIDSKQMNKIKEFVSQKKMMIDELEFENPIEQDDRNYKEKVTPTQLLNYIINIYGVCADIINQDVLLEHVEKQLNYIIDGYTTLVDKNNPKYFLTHMGKNQGFENKYCLVFSKTRNGCDSYYFSKMHYCVKDLLNQLANINMYIVSSKKKIIKIINDDISNFISGKNVVIVFDQCDREFRALRNLIMPLPNNLLDDMSEEDYSSEIKDKHKYDLRWN
jgi:hypothetical protein